MKKKSFFSFFIKRWIPMLIVAGFLASVATYYIHEKMYTMGMSYEEDLTQIITTCMSYDMEQLQNMKNSSQSPEEILSMENQIIWQLSGYKPCAIYDASTMELVYPKKDLAILVHQDPTETRMLLYSCPLSYFDSIEIDRNYSRPPVYTCDMLDYYINPITLQFLPGNVEVTEWYDTSTIYYTESTDSGPDTTQRAEERFMDSTQITSTDLTPGDTSGYTHVESSAFLISFSPIPEFVKDSETFDILMEMENNVYFYDDENPMLYQCLDATGFRANGNSYILVSEFSIDIWEMGKTYFIGTYVGLFFASIFIAIISALLSYKRHEMLRYQRNLTNALAHDLKSPLMVVSGYVQNLSDNVYPEKKDTYTAGISQNVQYMNDIINNILELSRINHKKSPLNVKAQNIAPIFEELLKNYDPLIREKQLSIRLSGDATIKCDTISLTRAFDNLITNAISHSPQKGTIEIQISNKQIIISNPYTNEINCKPEKLLEPFTKGDNSRGESTGTGIGLSIVNSILKLHKFSIKLSIHDDIFDVTIKL